MNRMEFAMIGFLVSDEEIEPRNMTEEESEWWETWLEFGEEGINEKYPAGFRKENGHESNRD